MMIRSIRVRVPPRVVQRASSRRSVRRYVTNDHISTSSSSSSCVIRSTSSLTDTNNNGCSIQKGTRQFSSSSFSSSSSPSNSSDPNSNNSPIQTQTVPTSNNNNAAAAAIPMIPINFDTSSSIQGDESQILQVTLQPNQVLRAESGAMIFMTQGVEMSTSLGGSSTTKDGSNSNSNSNSNNGSAISDGFKRMLTGQNMFISEYTYNGTNNSSNGTNTGTVALGTDFPSKIIKLNLSEYNQKLICQKSSYLASDSNNVSIQMEYTKKLSIGFFGGEGFILQGLVGSGDVFVKVGGVLVMKELDIGEVLRISSGSLVAFTQDVDYDIQTMPGFKNVLFGGEGLFVTTLTGPGTVWLQGMPPDRMISEIVRKIPSGGIGGLGIPIGLGGGGTDGSDTDGESEGSEGDGADSGADNGEDLVASTDAAIEADRNAAVASSGFSNDVGDSESSSALFGDASPSSTLSSSASSAAVSSVSPPIDNDQSIGVGGGVGEESDFTTFSDNDTTTTTMPDLDDSSSFSTDFSTSSNSNSSNDDYDDLTNNNQFDDFQQDETSFSTGLGDGGGDGDGLGDGLGEDGSSILNTLWDLFFDNDD